MSYVTRNPTHSWDCSATISSVPAAGGTISSVRFVPYRQQIPFFQSTDQFLLVSGEHGRLHYSLSSHWVQDTPRRREPQATGLQLKRCYRCVPKGGDQRVHQGEAASDEVVSRAQLQQGGLRQRGRESTDRLRVRRVLLLRMCGAVAWTLGL